MCFAFHLWLLVMAMFFKQFSNFFFQSLEVLHFSSLLQDIKKRFYINSYLIINTFFPNYFQNILCYLISFTSLNYILRKWSVFINFLKLIYKMKIIHYYFIVHSFLYVLLTKFEIGEEVLEEIFVY